MGIAELDKFRHEVNINLAFTDVDLPVVGDDGSFPVIVALDDERLSVVLGRLRSVGSTANLLVRGVDLVRVCAVIADECAIPTPDDQMLGDESPGVDATVGMFLDYVARHENGVLLPAILGSSARARDAGAVDLAAV